MNTNGIEPEDKTIIHGDAIGGDKVSGNKVEVGSITNSHNINIAGRDIVHLERTEAEQITALRESQSRRVQQAARVFAETQIKLRQTIEHPVLPDRPYKGLYYFTEDDIAIFHGREEVSKQLAARLMQPNSRVFVLHAPSGTGKTSLIQAGVIPQLLRRGCYTMWVEPNERFPFPKNIYQVFKELASGIEIDDLPWEEFLGQLKAALGLSSKNLLVIFLDQFERNLTSNDESSLDTLKDHLAAAVLGNDSRLPMRLVISIRSDYFGLLDEKFSEAVPGLLEQRLALHPLNREQALEAIISPMEGRSVSWEPGAAQSVLDYLGRGEIEPPHLQLICDQLYEKAVKGGYSNITNADVGETDLEALHRQYLNNQMSALGKQQVLGWALLKQLVKSDGVSNPRQLTAIVETLGSEVINVVQKLIERRVLRRSGKVGGFGGEPTGETELTIAHETLAQEILSHETDNERRMRVVRGLIERGLEDWRSHESHPLLNLERLKILDEYRDVFQQSIFEQMETDQMGLEFLLHSVLEADHEVSDWFECVVSSAPDKRGLVMEGMKTKNFRHRVALVQTLGRMGHPFIEILCAALGDEYPQVRVAAIRVLEGLQPSGEWRAHLKFECYVPAGPFIMGDDNSDMDNVKPAHEIYLEAFYVGKYLVTRADYQRFVTDRGRGYNFPAVRENHPVGSISWRDACEYAAWAEMRLPTEAEWEKAASWKTSNSDCLDLGRKRVYPWGDEFDKNYCNTSVSGIRDTTPVGHYSPNGDSPYGCADMAGNVWEWTSSLLLKYPYNKNDGRENPEIYGERVLRGGSFYDDPGYVRCAFRRRKDPTGHVGNLGFRTVCLIVSYS